MHISTSPRPVQLVRLVWVVKYWFTSRTVCELHIIRGTWGVYTSPRHVGLVRVVKQWLTRRTVCELHIIRETWGEYTSPRPVRLVRLVRVVKQWLTSRTVCELHIIRETWGVYTSPRPVLVRVVKQWLNAPIDGLPQDGGGGGVGQPRGNLTFSGFEMSISPPLVFIVSKLPTPGDH